MYISLVAYFIKFSTSTPLLLESRANVHFFTGYFIKLSTRTQLLLESRANVHFFTGILYKIEYSYKDAARITCKCTFLYRHTLKN